MTPEHRPFVEAIREAEPEDPAPSRVYADWLEERGELVYANYIRACVERSIHPDGTREYALADAIRHRLAPRLRAILERAFPASRGIPFRSHDSVDVDADDFLPEHGFPSDLHRSLRIDWRPVDIPPDALRARVENLPLHTFRVAVRDRRTGLRAHARAGFLRHIRRLALHEHPLIRPDGALARPELASVRSLILHLYDIEFLSWDALRACPRLDELDCSCVTDVEISDPVARLLDHPEASRLRSLAVRTGPHEIGRLAVAPFLRQLAVDHNDPSRTLPQDPRGLANLRSLRLDRPSYEAESSLRVDAVLASRTDLANLARLGLTNAKLGDDALPRLLAPSLLPALVRLDLSGNRLELARADLPPPPESLRAWNISTNHLAPEGLRNLLARPGLARLHELRLSENELGDAGAEALARAPATAAPNLLRLDLRCCNFHDDTARAFARAPILESIESLDLRRNPFRADGRRILRHRFGERVLL